MPEAHSDAVDEGLDILAGPEQVRRGRLSCRRAVAARMGEDAGDAGRCQRRCGSVQRAARSG